MKQKNVALKQKLTGGEGFESYYSSLFKSRWPVLKKSLQKNPLYVRLNFSCEADSCQAYFIDAASVCAALCLPISSDAQVLDLCAAPGGKSLVISGNLKEGCLLYSNELSPERKKRLDKVLSESLPEKLKCQLLTSCSDGATWCKRETEVFSSILLDAPCSSERHVITDSHYLAQWTTSRIKTLAVRQWALLSSAWRLLVPGGFLLYATCALTPDENDGVLSRLFKKYPDAKRVEKTSLEHIFDDNLSSFSGTINKNDGEGASLLLKETFQHADETEFGLHILPDCADSAGPLYFTLLQKNGVISSLQRGEK